VSGYVLYDPAARMMGRAVLRCPGNDDLSKTLHRLRTSQRFVNVWMPIDEYHAAIRTALDEHGLGASDDFRRLVTAVIWHESGFRILPRYIPALPLWTKSPRDRTIGPMRAAPRSSDEQWKILTVSGGVSIGTDRLATLARYYDPTLAHPDAWMDLTLADYNAGDFASRNAGFQRAINHLLRAESLDSIPPLAEDGGLLILVPADGPGVRAVVTENTTTLGASDRVSRTEAALRVLAEHYRWPLTPERIRDDLLLMRQQRFDRSLTVRLVAEKTPLVPAMPTAAYQRRIRAILPPRWIEKIEDSIYDATGLTLGAVQYVRKVLDKTSRITRWESEGAPPAGVAAR
jgi:hypothetical protein